MRGEDTFGDILLETEQKQFSVFFVDLLLPGGLFGEGEAELDLFPLDFMSVVSKER